MWKTVRPVSIMAMLCLAYPAHAGGLARVGGMLSSAKSDVLTYVPIIAALVGIGVFLGWWWHWIPGKWLARGAVALVAIGSIDAIVSFCMGG